MTTPTTIRHIIRDDKIEQVINPETTKVSSAPLVWTPDPKTRMEKRINQIVSMPTLGALYHPV
jgi:hypothetical protein